ncbi:MAG: glycosyltransferase family 2 protein [Spirochaetia bacterium]|nr:glycosyltransferase family 2 protein [Spirochaetia bacterium]
MAKKLSIIMPVYNEQKTIKDAILQVKKAGLTGVVKQLIIVDDGSTDGTRDILKKIEKNDKNLEIIFKQKNGGKGSAIREGIKHIKGDYAVIQDADLEYDPEDYGVLLHPIMRGSADVVYGSRFLGQHRSFLFWNYLANKILTFTTNILYNTILTDMETCYKMFRADVLKSLDLHSNGFDIEPEITAKILKKRYKIYEVPINFYGRSYDEGKKIKAMDGFVALWALIKYRVKG